MNRNLIRSNNPVPLADTVNEAGGKAYETSPEHALAQYVLTGCLNSTYYVGAEAQLDKVVALSQQVSDEFVAKLAIYARHHGYMKDTPVILLAALVKSSPELFTRAFPQVIDNAKMLRNFVQVMRSGVMGRKSLGTVAKRAVQTWLASKTESELFRGIIGDKPSLADIIRLSHPRASHEPRQAFYKYVLGYPKFDHRLLPPEVVEYELFRTSPVGSPPDVPFLLLSGLEMTPEQWCEVAVRMPWHGLRMNLNTIARKGVFRTKRGKDTTPVLADRLRDPEAIRKSKVFPFQLFSAYLATKGNPDIPRELTLALQDAAEVAVQNIPAFTGTTAVGVDVSGSMKSPVTGDRGSATTSVRCVDAAGLLASAILRKNPSAVIIPFDTRAHDATQINPRDSIMTNAEKLAAYGGGGTDCSLPVRALLASNIRADNIIIVSDNESWAQMYNLKASAYHQWQQGQGGYRGIDDTRPELAKAWNEYVRKNPASRLVCLDMQPNATVQAKDAPNVLNVGGFSDNVFSIIAGFTEGKTSFVDAIKAVQI